MNDLLGKGRRLLMPVVAVIFLGQSLVSLSIPCSMMNDYGSDISSNTHHVDHSDHHLDHASSDKKVSTICCDGFGYCSMANCLSAFALPSPGFTPSSDDLSIPDQFAFIAATSHSQDSLFRPPILG